MEIAKEIMEITKEIVGANCKTCFKYVPILCNSSCALAPKKMPANVESMQLNTNSMNSSNMYVIMSRWVLISVTFKILRMDGRHEVV